MGKAKQYTSNLYRMVGIYAGSGLYNFNLYVKQGGINLTYGASTFSALTGVLSRFGLNIFGGNTVEEMPLIVQTSTNGYVYASNIYSSSLLYQQPVRQHILHRLKSHPWI